MTSNGPSTVRMNVPFRAGLMAELKKRVPERQRARFINEAVERALRQLRLQNAIEESAGAWADADHPELIDGEAIDHYLESNRAVANWDRNPEA